MSRLGRSGFVSAVAIVCSVATVSRAAAHSIGVDASGKSTWEFLPLGIEHMLLGWDHLLFVAGVVLLAWKIGRAAKLVSVFVLGHSTTLIAATLAGWRVNPTAVDAAIGLSVCFVGVVGLVGRPRRWGWFAAVVLGFGLLHGLGLSTRLQDLGLPEDGLLSRVVAFNLGIEVGQLAAILVLVGLGRLVREALRRPRVQQVAFGALAVTGTVSAAIFAAFAAVEIVDSDEGTQVASATNTCTTEKRTIGFRLGGGGHPEKEFYEAAETIPSTDFAHVIGDGYLVLTYPPSLPPEHLAALRGYVLAPHKVVAGPMPDQSAPLRVLNAFTMLTCDQFDLDAARAFGTAWFADPRSRSPE